LILAKLAIPNWGTTELYLFGFRMESAQHNYHRFIPNAFGFATWAPMVRVDAAIN
jgi:hypothetical protein